MVSPYPASIPARVRPTSPDELDSIVVPHAAGTAEILDDAEAVMRTLGSMPQGGYPTVAARIAAISGGTDIPSVFAVTSFGALGDGVHDDTSAINEAINAAVSGGGGTVLIPPGDYRITSPIGLWGEDWEFDPDTLPEIVGKIRLLGLGGRYSTTLKPDDAFPALAGRWDYCVLADFDVDGGDHGASGVDIQATHLFMERMAIINWGGENDWIEYPSIAGLRLNCGTYDTPVGYLNMVRNCSISTPNDDFFGIGMDVGYRATDSWIFQNNIGSTEANIRTEGGPVRISQNHLNGDPRKPRHNVLALGGRRTFIMDNIMESAREESVKLLAVDEEWWADLDQQIHIRGNSLPRATTDTDTYAAILLQGKSATERVRGAVIEGNQIAAGDVDTWARAVHAKWFDELTIVGNNWYNGYTATEPVRLEDCGPMYEVIGNGGRNGVALT